MDKKTSETDRTVIRSDEYVRESAVQGGKIIAEHLAFGCILFGVPLSIIGLLSLVYMVCISGVPQDTPLVLLLFSPHTLLLIIGSSFILSGYVMYHERHGKSGEKH